MGHKTGVVDVTATLTTPHPPSLVHAVVADLGTYPAWLDIVSRVEPDGDAAWSVDLEGRIGPLARSKRLRMVRVDDDRDGHVSFTRGERDDRHHADWVLDATTQVVDGDQSLLTMHLHYGGRLWLPVLERILQDEITRSRPRLVAYLDARTSST